MTLRLSRANYLIFALFLCACGGSGVAPNGAGQGGTTPSGGSSSGSAGTPSSTGGSASGSSSAGQNSGGEVTAGTGGAPTGGSAGSGGMPSTSGIPDDATVVLFLIDGLQPATVETGVAAGASNIKFLIDNGVRAEVSYSTSPAARLQLPDNSQPWGNATSGNVAVHTGCHLNESNMMDDIFLAARAAGITSVFSGGDPNYAVFTTPDAEYASDMSDAETVQAAIGHIQDDDARLVRIHLQRIRDFWTGPAGETSASSTYIQHLVEVDGLLGELRAALEQKGVWDRTYVVLSSDHGMGQQAASDHPPNDRSSWENVTVFYGPGVKKGATIPYAELPDLAVMTAHLLKLPALKGHTDPAVTLTHKGPTGTLLTNIFEGGADVAHMRYIETYLDTDTYMDGGTGYSDYRLGMLSILE